MAVFEHEKHQKLWKFLASQAKAIIKTYKEECDSEGFYSEFRAASDTLRKWKEEYLKEYDKYPIYNGCYACQYAVEITGTDAEDYCNNCPFGENFFCDTENSPYDLVIDSIISRDVEELQRWCSVIANYAIQDWVM